MAQPSISNDPVGIPSVPIVFFGPAGAGKSTMLGYLLTVLTKVDLDKTIARVKKNYPDAYASAYDYAYLVDQGYDEIHRERDSQDLGTTKRMHVAHMRIQIDERTVQLIGIDTPGSWVRWREQKKGLYYGEVGIFCIEMLEWLGQKKRIDALLPLEYWLKSSARAPVIIALTQSDRYEALVGPVDDDVVDKARKLIAERLRLPEANSLIMVPTEIKVPGRTSDNIVNPSRHALTDNRGPLMPQVVNAVRKLLVARQSRDNEHGYLMAVDREVFFGGVHGSHGKVLQGKVLQGKVLKGEVGVGDLCRVLPAKFGEEPSFRSDGYLAKISSIKHGEVSSMIAKSGDIIGVMFQSKRMRSYSPGRTTILIDGKQQYLTGTLIEFRADSGTWFDHTSLRRMLSIVWFGKVISASVVESRKVSNGTNLICELEAVAPVAMPIEADGAFMIKRVLVNDRSQAGPEGVPIPAELVRIGRPYAVAMSTRHFGPHEERAMRDHFRDRVEYSDSTLKVRVEERRVLDVFKELEAKSRSMASAPRSLDEYFEVLWKEELTPRKR